MFVRQKPDTLDVKSLCPLCDLHTEQGVATMISVLIPYGLETEFLEQRRLRA